MVLSYGSPKHAQLVREPPLVCPRHSYLLPRLSLQLHHLNCPKREREEFYTAQVLQKTHGNFGSKMPTTCTVLPYIQETQVTLYRPPQSGINLYNNI